MQPRFHILRPGFQALFQDPGRFGFRQYGISPAGAADAHSHRLANLLLNNPPEAATLEVTLGGLVLEVLEGGPVAVAGAGLNLYINKKFLPGQRSLMVKRGDLLELRPSPQGARIYLAVPGGFDVPPVLGSRSTHQKSGVGPARVQAGQMLKACAEGKAFSTRFFLPVPVLPEVLQVRVLPGPEWEDLPLLQQVFVLTPQADRMGLRLGGTPIQLSRTVEMFSVAVLPGTVQLPPGGHPVVLLTDAQTTGGYPRIFQVIAADLWMLGQVLPGQRIQFVPVDFAEAEHALQVQEQEFKQLAATLRLYR